MRGGGAERSYLFFWWGGGSGGEARVSEIFFTKNLNLKKIFFFLGGRG